MIHILLKVSFITDGVIIPSNTTIIIYLYGMGHNPRTHDRVDVFDPDRFSKENRENVNAYEYIPFSAGHRNCVGQKYAFLNLRIFLSTLIRKFEFEASNEPGYKLVPMSNIVYNSQTGVRVKVKQRSF